MRYQHVIKAQAALKIRRFYWNVFMKYRHTYSYSNMESNVNQTIDAIYLIERSLLRRRPTLTRWQNKGWYMAHAGTWYYAYTINGDTIIIEDACHSQNMHED